MKPHIREIDHVVLRVTDLDAMTRFYCDALGCHVEKVQQDLGLVQLRAGKSLIDLLARGTPEQSHNMDHLCLRIEPFDAVALRAHLDAHGARPGDAERRYGADGYGPSIYLYDPEGNMVELKGLPQAAAH